MVKMSNALPILGQPNSLDPKLVEKCAQGACTRCGLCCVIYSVDVPSIRGTVDSVLRTKRAGEVCPQLFVDYTGQFACALQKEKEEGDPRLASCTGWPGAENTTAQLSVRTVLMAQKPSNIATVHFLQKLVQRGITQIFDFEITLENVCTIVKNYISLGVFPVDIFNELGIKRILRELRDHAPKKYEKLDHEIWQKSHELYDIFQDFMGNIRESDIRNRSLLLSTV